jgi:phosphoglycerol geranylgeranyltransferase
MTERADRVPARGVWSRLLDDARARGAAHLVLIDPDRTTPERAGMLAREAAACDVSALLLGSSTPFAADPAPIVRAMRGGFAGPLLLFPGDPDHVRGDLDAILFLSLLSARDPRYLIEAQVAAAPRVIAARLESIATGYLLIGDQAAGTVARATGTDPIPAHRAETIVAHAQAAACLGFALLYLEAGSAAPRPVDPGVVRAVAAGIPIPIAVGGGIRDPAQASALVAAGARFIVTGTAHETGMAVRPFTEAIHVPAHAAP